MRASFDAARGIPRTHIVPARLDCGLTVGQAAVPDKANELTAIRQLLPARELEGRVVSIDALACQTDIAETIAEGGGWYLLAVKDNQFDLHANLRRDFAYLDRTARYYITNLPVTVGAAAVADLVRGHWGIENSLHWVLDDTFREDRCRLHTGHAARNMAALRRIALNFLTLLKQYFWPKMSIRRLRKRVARNPAQLDPIMAL